MLVDKPIHDRYLEFHQQQVAANSRHNQETADRVGLGLLLLGACGSVAGLAGGFAIARGISRSLVRLSLPVHDAAGKLNEVVGPIELSAAQGVAGLEQVLHQVADRVSDVVERLQHSQRDALRAEQLAAVGQWAAGLTHELRNPLMAMKLLVQSAVERGSEGSIQGRNLAVLDEEIKRQEQAIQAFLDFARPPKLEPRDFDLREVVNETVALATGRATRQGARIDWERATERVMAQGDPLQIRQVALNLLFNALESLGGEGTVRVSLVQRKDGESNRALGVEWLELRIADTGPGLPTDLGHRIFEPFVSTKETGMGLGLSISRRIVEAHGGEIIAADRTDGPGAEFVVRLPAAVAAAAPVT